MKLRHIIHFILFFIYSGFTSAQDYLISFEGSGAVPALVSVQVENITKGTKVTIAGTHILHLKAGIITGHLEYKDLGESVSFSPNPMTEKTFMRFITPDPSSATISLFDISGKKLYEKTGSLQRGLHTYSLSGITKGIYYLKVRAGRFESNGTLICSYSLNSNPEIIYENTISIQDEQDCTEVIMQYSQGDKMKFTGFSGICSTVFFDDPYESKTIRFIFNPATDADGNDYPAVQIGSQLWMAENLKTTSYRDNTPIPNVTDGVKWAGLTTPAYCWYNNNIRNKDVYGALYNWYVVETGKLCPEGWHVPADDEWHELILHLDQNAGSELEESSIAGGMLKEKGTAHWTEPNEGATDEFGFKALPAGVRRYDGVFGGPTGNGNWRTSSQYDDTQVWYRYIFYYSASIYRKPTNMQAGYSVRCISD